MSNVIVYTICTSSHLGQAKGMGDSLLRHNPSYKLIIGLVDKLGETFDKSFFAPFQILEVEDLGIPEFSTMQENYTLLGLTCALKSFYGNYLLETYRPDMIIYLDTDILVFHSFEYLEQELADYSIIITPHITSPYPNDDKNPSENVILNVGIFNGGFFALRNDDNAKSFLYWWKLHMKDKCYEDFKDGLFDDQIWLNFVPLYYQRVCILKHAGYNIAYWNIHERLIEKEDNQYIVNKKFPLVFFHFSGYSIQNPELLTRHQNRYDFTDLPVCRELCELYIEILTQNKHQYFLTIECAYIKKSKLKIFFTKLRSVFFLSKKRPITVPKMNL